MAEKTTIGDYEITAVIDGATAPANLGDVPGRAGQRLG
jgi:hypothetical protein